MLLQSKCPKYDCEEVPEQNLQRGKNQFLLSTVPHFILKISGKQRLETCALSPYFWTI